MLKEKRRHRGLVLALTAAAFPVTWLVCAVDAVRAASRADMGASYAVLLGTGLGSLVAPVVALALWVLMAVLPIDARPTALVSTTRSWLGLRGRDGAELCGKALAVATVSCAFLLLCYRLSLFFMTRFHNTRLAALTLAVALLVLVVVLALAFAKVRDLLTGVLARSSLLSRPLVWGVFLCTVAAGCVAALIERNWQTVEAIRFGPALVPLVIGVGTYLLGFAVLTRGPAFRAVSCCAMLTVGLVLAITASRATSEEATLGSYALAEYSSFLRIPLGAVSASLDQDGDGVSSAFGGGDCDDENPDVSPWANEIPNNGVDEDCSGEDLALDVEAFAPWQSEAPASQPSDRLEVDPVVALQQSWDVIVITIDALRWDHVGYAGYDRPDITPNIDALAERSVRFRRAYSTSAKTPTSIPSILASRWPSEMYRTFDHFSRFGGENLFLAEVLTDNGYTTAASTSHWYLRPRYGFAQGFQDWREYWVSGDRMERVPTSEQVADNALAFLTDYYQSRDEAPEDSPPYFLWVHFLDPHKLYIDHDGFEPYGNSSMDRYDGEIRFADHHAGRIVSFLAEREVLEDTVVFLSSDHGEAFGEHGMRHHGWDLYEHQIRVPLSIYIPGVEPRDIEQSVSLIDLAPTIVDLMGDAVPDEFRGRSLLPAIARGEEPELMPVFSEMPRGPHNTPKRSFTMGDWKLIHHPRGGRFRLFNLDEDPGELTDRWRSDEEEAQRIREAYEVFLATQVDSRRARGEED